MGSIPYPTGKGRWNKCFLKNRAYHGKYCVMQNPIPDSRFMDMPLLRVADIKPFIRSVLIRLIFQFAMQAKNILLAIHLKFHHIQLLALVAAEHFPSGKQVLGRDHSIE